MAERLIRGRPAAALAGLAATVVVTVAGCGSAAAWGGHLSADPALDVNRANWVQDSISNAISLGPLTEQGLAQIVADNGGGYVTRVTVTGPRGAPGQQLTMDTVLGSSPVRSDPPTGTVNSPDGDDPVECFTFTIGWLNTVVAPPVREDCPETALGAPSAVGNREAAQVSSAGNLAAVLAVSATPVPVTRRDVLSRLAAARGNALKELRLNQGLAKASQEWAYATDHLSFAPGKALAAAALPVQGGGCVYLTFAPGSNPRGTVTAWPAPIAAPCTGSAALAASGPVTDDTGKGG